MSSDVETTFRIEPFDALTLSELYAILHLRNRVFVAQQEITAEPDVDGRDPECHHAMLWRADAPDSARTLLATGRLFMADDPVVVGRVAVTPKRQREGLGTELMHGIQRAIGARPAELHAQAYLEEWYAKLGWERHGEPFLEADIEHVMMRRNVDDAD